MPSSLELAPDLSMKGPLVGFDGQEQVSALLLAPLNNGRVVWKATPAEKAAPTAWIRTPSRSSMDSRSRREPSAEQ